MRVCLFIALILLTGCTSKNSSITSIYKFSDIPINLISQDTIILIDIDNTILRTATNYGSVEHFEHLHKEAENKTNLTQAQIKLKLLEKWRQAQEKISTQLVDENVNSFIKKALDNKITIIAFTAREPLISELSYNQLKFYNIFMSQLPKFSFSTSSKNQIFPDNEWCKKDINIKICEQNPPKEHHISPSIFYKGILFAHALNHKGRIFYDFYTQYKDYAKKHKLTIPTKVIFIDDKMHNLTSMKEACKHLKLNFHGYHLITNFSFNLQQAQQEEISLSKN